MSSDWLWSRYFPADFAVMCALQSSSLCGSSFESKITRNRARWNDVMPNSFGCLTRCLNVGLVTAAMMLANAATASAAYKAEAAVPVGAPLAFGMSQDQASAALGVPLGYIRGSRGNELLLALPNVKGSALTIRSDGLYLQFRRGRLTGWKGDWGTARPPVVGW
jgi:hypothetical protein